MCCYVNGNHFRLVDYSMGGDMMMIHEGYVANDQELLMIVFSLCKTFLARLVYLDGTTTDSRRAKCQQSSNNEDDE